MNDVKRTTSIARRFGRREVGKEFDRFFFTDLLFVALLALGMAFYIEHKALGDNWTINLARSFSAVDGGDWVSTIKSITYRFGNEELALRVVAVGEQIALIICGPIVVFILQTFSLFATV